MTAGRVALVTGASRGIGRATAVALGRRGHRVAVAYRQDVERAEIACAAISEAGGEAAPQQMDVASRESVDRGFACIEDSFGPVEVLVSNAGITRDGLLMRMGFDQWASVLRTNLDGAFHVIRRATPGMVRRRYGRIVTVSSVSGVIGTAGQANYAASKAGMVGLTRVVARELASRGITANAVLPGPVETDLIADLSDEQRAALVESVPLGRMATVEEVAAVIAFLCSEEASYVTGAAVAVDGGAGMGH